MLWYFLCCCCCFLPFLYLCPLSFALAVTCCRSAEFPFTHHLSVTWRLFLSRVVWDLQVIQDGGDVGRESVHDEDVTRLFIVQFNLLPVLLWSSTLRILSLLSCWTFCYRVMMLSAMNYGGKFRCWTRSYRRCQQFDSNTSHLVIFWKKIFK